MALPPPRPLVTRLSEALQSDEGNAKFWMTVAVLVVLHLAWTRLQQARKNKTTNHHITQQLSPEEQAAVRRRRFERLQQQGQSKINAPKENRNKKDPPSISDSESPPTTNKNLVAVTDDDDSKNTLSSAKISNEEEYDVVAPTKKKKTTPPPSKTPAQSFLIVLRALLNADKHAPPTPFWNQAQATIPPNATWDEIRDQHWPSLVQQHLLKDDNYSMRQALKWLHRIRDVIQYSPVSTETTKPYLEACLNCLLRQEITQRMANDLWQEAQKESLSSSSVHSNSDKEEDFELGALFSEDYGDTAVTSLTTQTTESKIVDALTDFLQLLEPIETLVSTRVMQDLHSHQPNLPGVLFQKALDRIPCIDPYIALQTTEDEIFRPLTCFANLVTLSDVAARDLHALIAQQVDDAAMANKSLEGRDMEKLSVLRKLMPIAALSIPNLGQETIATSSQGQGRKPLSFFQKIVRQQVEQYPVGAFMNNNQSNVGQVINDTRRIMDRARDKCTVILKRAIKAESKKKGQRPYFFRWLSLVLKTNESNVHVLASDLLRENAPHQICASRKFLLGTASTVVSFCVDALWERYHKLGSEAFDPLFLIHPDMGLVVEGERSLLPLTDQNSIPVRNDSNTFAGMTEFFFLSSALLRVCIFPGLRAEQELGRQHGPLLDALRRVGQASRSDQQIPPNLLDERAKASVDAWLGWETALHDPELVRSVTKFSILQLKWLASAAGKKLTTQSSTPPGFVLSVVPEWFCKLPAEWIAFVATRAPKMLSVADGEAAVECSTMLLHLGTEFQGQDFSPPVITELIRIPGAFIRSGVARARALIAGKSVAALRGISPEEKRALIQNFIVDERKCDFDIAFDRNGLGTTAFTNTFVQNRLSSTLISTFIALDGVEGMNVEREHAFDKFHVKGEVAELLLRLWSHPSGGARRAILGCPSEELSVFVSSLVSAIGLQVDDSCLKLLDIREILKKSQSRQLVGRDVHYYDYMAKNVAGGFAGARKLLRLLMNIAQYDETAATLGGYVDEGKEQALPVTRALANLFLSLVERFTSEDGRMNTDFHSWLGADIDTNKFLFDEFGLDVGVFVHFQLALAGRLHSAFTKASRGAETGEHGTSPFVKYLTENEDCSASHLQAVLSRLVMVPDQVGGHKAEIKGTKKDNGRRWSATQDQMTHQLIDEMAARADIETFIGSVQAAKGRTSTTIDTASGVHELEKTITLCSSQANEDVYTDHLGEWTFSSDSFQTATGRFDHSYDGLARKRSHVASAKILQKEAKKTQKLLPDPVASAAIFVCFAEERMDIAKAIITGAESTPYSLGLFVFDLFFPATYPSVPPLVTFRTTGGGQTRFNANLYNDGKVCISLLGTAHAWSSSQQWNEDSSLAQVLLSIQTQILGANDPYFGEGFGHANNKGTQRGEEASARYNNTIRLATVRHAMIDHLRSPPRGFEEVTIRHFSLCRKRLTVQGRRWMVEARGTSIEKKFDRAYATLIKLLSSERFAEYDDRVLPPLDDDVEVLRRLDPEFVQIHLNDDSDTKPSAIIHNDTSSHDCGQNHAVSTSLDPNLARALVYMIGTKTLMHYNPWATETECEGAINTNNRAQPNNGKHESSNGRDIDSDDEMYR